MSSAEKERRHQKAAAAEHGEALVTAGQDLSEKMLFLAGWQGGLVQRGQTLDARLKISLDVLVTEKIF